MSSIINYILIGLSYTFILEILWSLLMGVTFSWNERISHVLIWPVSIVIFIIGMFK